MPHIPPAVIADIIDRTDIVQLIGEYVTLRKAGVNHLGLCPFHNEKTPSFNVNPPRRIFHCFGCQEGGDAIRFLMKVEGLNFVEAAERLASRAGVEIPKTEEWKGKSLEEKDHEQRLYGVNKLALAFFREQLNSPDGERARHYLLQRDVLAPQWEKHQLGFAPNQWDGFLRYLQRNGASYVSSAEEVGLLVNKEGRRYDRFRDRIMFPVYSANGEISGFSGRTLDPDAKDAKYLNSPESSVFKKGESFLGLGLAKGAMRKTRSAVLVEGNFDYLSLHERGIEEAVAPMGTALTPGHVRVLRRFAGESVVLLYDGDNAGEKASVRAIPLLLEAGLSPKVAALPPKEDPDSFARRSTPEELRAFVSGAKDAIEHLITTFDAKTRGDIPARARAAEDIAQIVANVRDAAAKELYVQRVSKTFWVEQKTLRKVKPAPGPREEEVPRPAHEALPKGELGLATLLMLHPNLRREAKRLSASRYLRHSDLRELVAALAATDPDDVTGEIILDSLANDGIKQALRAALVRPAEFDEDAKRAEQRLVSTVQYLQEQSLTHEISALDGAIKAAKAAGDEEKSYQLTVRLMSIKKEQDLLRRAMAKVSPA